MKKKNNIFFGAALLMLSTLCLVSCDSFLDADNKASLDAEEYFQTKDGQVALRVSLYNGLRPMVCNTELTEYGTDLYLKTRTSEPNQLYKYTFDASNASIRSYYVSAYTMINNANCVLKYAAANAQYVAEAKFVRCYGYYLLTQQFGAVPYVTEYIESGRQDYPRTPLSTIYQSIIAELESIADDSSLPETDLKGNISRQAVKCLLAKVYLAAGWDLQTSLTDGVQGTYTVNSTEYFGLAAQMAESIISGHSLTMSFEDKWSPFNEGNAEEIFAVQYERNGFPGDEFTGGHSRQSTYGTGLGSPQVNGMKSCGELAPSQKSIRLWDQGDDRYAATFMLTIYNFTGTWPKSGYFAAYHTTAAEQATMPISCKYFPWYATETEINTFINSHRSNLVYDGMPQASQVFHIDNVSTLYTFQQTTGADKLKDPVDYLEHIKEGNRTASVPPVKKFDDANTPQIDNATGFRDVVMLHMSMMYLVAAEAQLMAGNEPRALQLVNDVRQRSHASTLASFGAYAPSYTVPDDFGTLTALDVILDECARELYAETTRWMDLRRTRQLIRYNVAYNHYIESAEDMCNSLGEQKWYRPIPAAEIQNNIAITEKDQNPGY